MAHEYSPVARMHCTDPHALKCRPGPCIEVAGAMSASREPCTVVRFIVWQRRLHASPPANELSWMLESKHLATPAIGNLTRAVSRYISQSRHLTRAEVVVITRLRIGHTKATKSHILSRGPPTACQHCGQTLTIEHILLECTVLQQSRDEYYTVDSLRTLFETIPEACIIEFLREAGFYYLIWMARYPTQLFIKSVTNWRHSQVELIPTTEHHH